jgi:hypothetical protein
MKCLKPVVSIKEWVIELSLPHHLRTSVGLPRDRKERTTYIKEKRHESIKQKKLKKVQKIGEKCTKMHSGWSKRRKPVVKAHTPLRSERTP